MEKRLHFSSSKQSEKEQRTQKKGLYLPHPEVKVMSGEKTYFND